MGRPRKKPKEAEDQSAPKNGKVGKKGAKLKPTPRVTRGRKAKEEVKVPVEAVESSDESNSDWEEVLNTEPVVDVDMKSIEQNLADQQQNSPVEVVIDAGTLALKDKKTIDLAKAVQRALNKERSEYQRNYHKAHVVCLIAHGIFINRQCNDETIGAVMVSLLPTGFAQIQPKTLNLAVLSKMAKWFCSAFPLGNRQVIPMATCNYWNTRLLTAIESKSVVDFKEAAMLLVTVLRSLGLDVRLVLSLQPVPVKPKSESKTADSKKKGKLSTGKIKSVPDLNEPSTSKNASKPKRDRISLDRLQEFAYKKMSNAVDKEIANQSVTFVKQTSAVSGFERPDIFQTVNLAKKAKNLKKKVEYDSDDSSSSSLEEQPKRKIKGKKLPAQAKNAKDLPQPEPLENSNEEVASKKQRLGRDCWVEVYVKTEERWISVDCVDGSLDKPDAIEIQCSQPVHYVFTFDNNGSVKDVTLRYSSRFASVARLMRAPHDWIKETLQPFASKQKRRDKAEDIEIHKHIVNQPLPGSINELKNHPVFCLKRDLKKYEAIYPPDAKRVGVVRGDPVYLRSDVYTLHSRDSWIKDARVIRTGEEPYKVVKARPKMGVPKEMQVDRPLPLFGFWQTEPYIPPVVVDGKVPRNEYGNVELYKPSMLPVGTVHLPISGLLQVAKKLNIDCAPAVVGWEFHGMGSHPVIEGFVVCEEHKETLLAAWDHYEAVQVDKEAEKRTQRAIKNWAKITKALVIRHKLTEKFKYGKTNAHLNVRHTETLESEMPGDSDEDSQEVAGSTSTAWPRTKKEFKLQPEEL